MTDASSPTPPAVGTLLIIGGTTEGRMAVRVCDEAARSYLYSTKEAAQQIDGAHAIRLSGGMDADEMAACCRTHDVRLIVDAAHPFAENVHRNVGHAARQLAIPVVRIERRFEPEDPRMHWFDTYDEAIAHLDACGINRLLALTGVNTIARLKPYWQRHTCLFRIMKRDTSLDVADRSGFPRSQLIFYEDERDDAALLRRLRPQAIITKQSGETGGFAEKTEAALALGIPVLVIRKPSLPYTPAATVYGRHGLRKQIERLLPRFFELRTGFTTGSCATAATRAAIEALLTGQATAAVTVLLPDGEPVVLPVEATAFHPDGSATCTVVKDAGDDPDVTNGLEICATVSFNPAHDGVRFLQGEGVGRVTLPGLGLAIGGPAINASPRRMMEQTVREALALHTTDGPAIGGVDITIAVPRGSEVAGRTFNPKLGIEGGISIIGTSGIVKPFSSEAFIGSIRREAAVARAMGVSRLVINSGAKSEKQLKALYPDAPPQAFVQYGNFIGETLKIAAETGFEAVTLGIMIGKAVKLAEGMLDTHSKRATMNRAFIQSVAASAGCSTATIANIDEITVARELWSVIPPSEYSFFGALLAHCRRVCRPLFPDGELTVLLLDETGKVVE